MKRAQLLKIKGQVPNIWAKGLGDCVCIFGRDITTSPWWREKVMVYYIIIHLKNKKYETTLFLRG